MHFYTDSLHCKALQKAQGKNIKVALSNVCFELWILLHFQINSAPYTSYDDLIRHSSLQSHLQKNGIPSYSKNETTLFQILRNNVEIAKDNATIMNQTTIDSAAAGLTFPYQFNPYTDVHRLLDAIDAFK